MSRRVSFTVLLGAALFAVSVVPASAERLAHAPHGGSPAGADLSGDQEVPPAATAATGRVDLTINRGHGEICYELSWQDLTTPATAAHIHRAPAGVNGPVVVPLSTTPTTTGSVADCAQVDRATAKAIAKNLDGYYVNVHTSTFTGGEIRGQLSK